jgi:hypothetical protein
MALTFRSLPSSEIEYRNQAKIDSILAGIREEEINCLDICLACWCWCTICCFMLPKYNRAEKLKLELKMELAKPLPPQGYAPPPMMQAPPMAYGQPDMQQPPMSYQPQMQ